MAAAILILCLGESFPSGFGSVLSYVFPVLSFLKARHLGAGWFRGPPLGFFLPVPPRENVSWLLLHPPFPLGGGGGGER